MFNYPLWEGKEFQKKVIAFSSESGQKNKSLQALIPLLYWLYTLRFFKQYHSLMWQRHLFAVLLLLGLFHVCLSATAAGQQQKKEPSFSEQAEAQKFTRWLLQESHLAKLMPINKPTKDPITTDWVYIPSLQQCMHANTTVILFLKTNPNLEYSCVSVPAHLLDSGIEE